MAKPKTAGNKACPARQPLQWNLHCAAGGKPGLTRIGRALCVALHFRAWPQAQPQGLTRALGSKNFAAPLGRFFDQEAHLGTLGFEIHMQAVTL